MQPNITTKGSLVTSSEIFATPLKLSQHIYYDDETYHLIIDKDGKIWTSNIYSFESEAGKRVWLTPNASQVPKDIQEGSKFLLVKDKKINNFPSRIQNTENNFTGDVWYLVADTKLFAIPVGRSGILDFSSIKSQATAVTDKDKLDKLMVFDSNVVVMSEKKIFIYQY